MNLGETILTVVGLGVFCLAGAYVGENIVGRVDEVRTLDVNGDGRQDIVVYQGKQPNIFLSQPDGSYRNLEHYLREQKASKCGEVSREKERILEKLKASQASN